MILSDIQVYFYNLQIGWAILNVFSSQMIKSSLMESKCLSKLFVLIYFMKCFWQDVHVI